MSLGLRTRAAYVLRTSWAGLRATPVPSAVAVLTIALSLLLVGSFVLVLSNMERILERFGEEFRVSAYLQEGLDEAAVEALLETTTALPGVGRVDWITKEAALARFRESAVGRAALVEGLDENPLPASLEIVLKPEERSAEGLERLATSLRDLPGVADLGYGTDWVEGYARALGLIRALALAIGGVLVLATLVIVTNTIQLALYARRDEIEILRLVGASRAFVAVPYLLEGFVQGCLGGLLGIGLLALLFFGLFPSIAGSLELILGHASPRFLDPWAGLGLVGAGAALGMIGSASALLQGRLDT